jgi:hypothetical protein
MSSAVLSFALVNGILPTLPLLPDILVAHIVAWGSYGL